MTEGSVARLLEASPALREALALHVLLAARLVPLAVLTPLLGLSAIAPPLRFVAALALAVGAAPAAALADGATLGARALLTEVLAGSFFAAIAALPLVAMGSAGRLVDQSRGVSHPGARELVEGEPASALGHLHSMAGLALFFSAGGHVFVLRVFGEGIASVPLGGVAPTRESLFGFVTLAEKALLFGSGIALPGFSAVLFVELFLGLFARAAPGLPVFHAGMPLRALAGLAAAALSVGVALALVGEELAHAAEAALVWLSARR